MPPLHTCQTVAEDTPKSYTAADCSDLTGPGADRASYQTADNRAADRSRNAAEFGVAIRDRLGCWRRLAGRQSQASCT